MHTYDERGSRSLCTRLEAMWRKGFGRSTSKSPLRTVVGRDINDVIVASSADVDVVEAADDCAARRRDN